MSSDGDFGRRTFIKGAGAAAAGAAIAGEVSADVDGTLDLQGEPQEAIVIFESRDDVDRLGDLSLPQGYYKYQALPFGLTHLNGEQIREVASWPEVEYVQGNHDIQWDNADARAATNVQAIQRSGYTGETVHVAVVDSGIDGDHPGHVENLEHNYRYANPFDAAMWEDAGPANTGGTGHGSHVSGTITGSDTPADDLENDQDHGMAPDAKLTVYSTTIGLGLAGVTGAYDDIIAKQRRGEHDIQVINNSYSGSAGNDYNPAGAHQRSTWAAYKEGILSVFSAGNAGPDTNTMSDYAAGPHVMSSAATTDLAEVAGFSSRGRAENEDGYDDGANWDRKEALEQVQAFYDAGLTTEENLVKGETRTGTLGAAGAGLANAENPDSPVTGSSYEKIEAPEDATLITLSVGWFPDGDNDVYLRKGAKDGEVVSSATTFTGNPETIRAQVEGGTTYWVEIRPFLNVVSEYTMEFGLYDISTSDIPDRPYGLHRPAVGTPGVFLNSTMDPADPLQGYGALIAANGVLPIGSEPEPETIEYGTRVQARSSDDSPYYGLLSGTSMSGPVLAGIAALVYDAYRQNHLEWPDPMDVIATIEATAVQTWADQTPFNAGAGFADAKAAVERAVEGDLISLDDPEYEDVLVDETVDEGAFVANADRSDGGDAFTAGQTIKVDLELYANLEAVVRDRVPSGWRVLDGDHDRVYTSGGERFVEFDGVPDANDGEPTTLRYFIEVPERAAATGAHEFGPAAARPADGGEFTLVTGADTNVVAGVDQNDV
jgi:serine protease AprX